MRKLFLFAALLLITRFTEAQPYFALHTTGSIRYLSSFQDAVAQSVSNDTIYVPGGSYYIGTTNINKKLFIYGVGYFPDSCVATQISDLIGNLRILSGADGGLLSGIRINGNIVFGTSVSNQTVHNYTITRCKIADYLYLSSGGTNRSDSKNISIHESIINGNFYGGYAESTNILKCILCSYVHYFDKSVFRNNNFLYIGYNNSSIPQYQSIHYILNSFFDNNNILQAYNTLFGAGSYIINNSFYNNVFRIPLSFPVNGNSGELNFDSFNATGMFVNVPTLNTYSDENDYHLFPASAAKNAGTDGKDIGIYGSAYPFKHIPVNPHIYSINIERQLSEDGQLNVSVGVSAQDR